MTRDELVPAVTGGECHRRGGGDAEHGEGGDKADHLHGTTLGSGDDSSEQGRPRRDEDEGREVRERARHDALVKT